MSARSVELNLLPKEVWEKGLVGQLLAWVLSVGRYVVVFTELVVISAFLYRFGLDRQLTDLRGSIKEKQSVINSFGDVEAVFRQVQTQLKIVKQVSDKPRVQTAISLISQILPVDAVLTKLTANQDTVIIEGRVASQTGLATLLHQAQLRPEFADVVLENVKSPTEKSSGIEFLLTINIKST